MYYKGESKKKKIVSYVESHCEIEYISSHLNGKHCSHFFPIPRVVKFPYNKVT